MLEYFEFDAHEEEHITELGLVVPLADHRGIHSEAITPHYDTMQDGFVVDLRELDPEIKIIRFINSY